MTNHDKPEQVEKKCPVCDGFGTVHRWTTNPYALVAKKTCPRCKGMEKVEIRRKE